MCGFEIPHSDEPRTSKVFTEKWLTRHCPPYISEQKFLPISLISFSQDWYNTNYNGYVKFPSASVNTHSNLKMFSADGVEDILYQLTDPVSQAISISIGITIIMSGIFGLLLKYLEYRFRTRTFPCIFQLDLLAFLILA
jgi:hypothetical protein